MSEKERSNIFKWLGIGCVVIIVCGGAFVAFLVMTVFGSMRSSDPYKEAMQRASTDPRVESAVGKPIEAGFFVSGNINTALGGTGNANLTIPISGPKGKASIHVVATKQGGRWIYNEMNVTPAKGEVIDLLTSSERSPSTTPPTS